MFKFPLVLMQLFVVSRHSLMSDTLTKGHMPKTVRAMSHITYDQVSGCLWLNEELKPVLERRIKGVLRQ